jgi:hypothetical protein
MADILKGITFPFKITPFVSRNLTSLTKSSRKKFTSRGLLVPSKMPITIKGFAPSMFLNNPKIGQN